MLVGMMGAGKSTIGRRLGVRLRLPFLDADIEIEAARRMSIPEIFETHGEPYFRDGEARVIARLLDERTGGDRHRRRRLHARGDTQPHPRKSRLDLAQGRCRYHHDRVKAPRRPPAAADRRSGGDRQPPARGARAGLSAAPTSRSPRATCRTTRSSTNVSMPCAPGLCRRPGSPANKDGRASRMTVHRNDRATETFRPALRSTSRSATAPMTS